VTLKDDKWDRYISFPLSSSNLGPTKEEWRVIIPRRATCTVKSTYTLITKIQNLRTKKNGNRLWLPHLPVHHIKMKTDTFTFTVRLDISHLHGETSYDKVIWPHVQLYKITYMRDFSKKWFIWLFSKYKFWIITNYLEVSWCSMNN
jgi:hypothetical protein